MKRVGIVGFGKRYHDNYVELLNVLVKEKAISVTAVFNRTPSKAKVEAKRLKAKLCSSYDALLSTNVDIVILLIPPIVKHEYAKKALNAGKNVFMETPAAPSTKDCDELVQLMKKTKRRVQVSEDFTFTPEMQVQYELSKQLKVGKPSQIINNRLIYSYHASARLSQFRRSRVKSYRVSKSLLSKKVKIKEKTVTFRDGLVYKEFFPVPKNDRLRFIDSSWSIITQNASLTSGKVVCKGEVYSIEESVKRREVDAFDEVVESITVLQEDKPILTWSNNKRNLTRRVEGLYYLFQDLIIAIDRKKDPSCSPFDLRETVTYWKCLELCSRIPLLQCLPAPFVEFVEYHHMTLLRSMRKFIK